MILKEELRELMKPIFDILQGDHTKLCFIAETLKRYQGQNNDFPFEGAGYILDDIASDIFGLIETEVIERLRPLLDAVDPKVTTA